MDRRGFLASLFALPLFNHFKREPAIEMCGCLGFGEKLKGKHLHFDPAQALADKVDHDAAEYAYAHIYTDELGCPGTRKT